MGKTTDFINKCNLRQNQKNKIKKMNECIISANEPSASDKPYSLVEAYLLNFDVLNKSGEEARELIAWLQMELKTNKRFEAGDYSEHV